MSRRGEQLRRTREAKGLSLADLSRRTRIPQEHLEALEQGREEDLPAGPYAAAYLRTLQEELSIDLHEETEVAGAEGPPPGLPLGAVRAIGVVSVVAVLGLIGWQTWTRYAADLVQASTAAAPAVPDQLVDVVARKNTRLTVRVDDVEVMDRAVVGGEELHFAGHDRIEIEVQTSEALRITYNGRTITPLGRQDAPRKLVFVDDLQGGP